MRLRGVDLCSRHHVPAVPVLYSGPFSLDVVRQHSAGKTTLEADHIREGVVDPVAERSQDPQVRRGRLPSEREAPRRRDHGRMTSRVIFEPDSPRGLIIILWLDTRRAVLASPFRTVDLSLAELEGLVERELDRRR